MLNIIRVYILINALINQFSWIVLGQLDSAIYKKKREKKSMKIEFFHFFSLLFVDLCDNYRSSEYNTFRSILARYMNILSVILISVALGDGNEWPIPTNPRFCTPLKPPSYALFD